MSRHQGLFAILRKQAIKVMANPEFQKQQKELGKLLRRQIKALTPKVKGAYKVARKKAIGYGIDVAPMEQKVSDTVATALERLANLGYHVPFEAPGRKKKASPKKNRKGEGRKTKAGTEPASTKPRDLERELDQDFDYDHH